MTEPKLLSRQDILGASDIQQELVSVPEWGGAVYVRGMTGTERDSFEASITEGQGRDVKINAQNLRAKLVARSVVDENGKPLFSKADVEALGKKSARALQRVFNVAQRLSGISDEDVETLAKN